jgi:PhzF family phenazine biosynthesis protein
VTRARTIRHVDAFTATALEGNPAAVVDGDGLDTATMQRIALNQHLSETVFLLPPASAAHSAHIRIFTPGTELPFAGHPTIAASHILVSEGRVRTTAGEPLSIETGAGVVPVEVTGDEPRLYTMTQARPQFRANDIGVELIADGLGLAPADITRAEWVSTGIFWLIAQIASLDAMLRVRPSMTTLLRIPHGISIFCIGAQTAGAAIHVRSFAPEAGVFEDPVTGSSNGCIGAFIAKHELMPQAGGAISYVAEQGLEMGQPGRVHVRATGEGNEISVQVGGNAVTVLRGELLLPD